MDSGENGKDKDLTFLTIENKLRIQQASVYYSVYYNLGVFSIYSYYRIFRLLHMWQHILNIYLQKVLV